MSMLKLYSIAFRNKIKIHRKDIDGGYARPALRDVVIPQDVFHTETRQTLAHELGHLLHPLGSCAPDEEVFMVNMVGFATDDVLKQEFAAWEWAIDHTEIDPAFLFKNLWGYCRMTAYRNVKSVGKDFQTVWTMIEDLIPVREPPRNPCTMFDTLRRPFTQEIPPFIGWDTATTATEYARKQEQQHRVVYGKEEGKQVITTKMLHEIFDRDPLMDWEKIEGVMKKYI